MIPYLSLQSITAMHGEEIQDAVTRVTAGGWYLHGEETQAFERDFALYTDRRHCVGCGNGLDALMLIISASKALGRMKDGDEIIVPANTYIASILAISECGLRPVLVEPRMETFQIDDSRIEQAVTPRTRAVMIVHLYGYDAYTERIGRICKDRGLMLIEDCAQAHGINRLCSAPRHERPMEPPFSAQAYSFYPGKNLGALGDAGCVATDDTELADTVRAFGNYGSAEKYVFRYKGRNSRMDEIQAAVLRVKLKYLDEDNQRRRMIARRYITEIRNTTLSLPPDGGVFHIFPVLCRDREATQRYLAEHGIATMIHYPIPPHKQDAYAEWNALSFPITERIHREELSLPCNQAMTDSEVDTVIDCLNKQGK